MALDKIPLGRLKTLPAMTSCEAVKRGKYLAGKVELDCTCSVDSGEVL